MKALTCEMCGSTNLIKEGGVFVCQSCGTKYSVEEAKKMMVEGTVDVKGTVKVDTSDELKNLYEIARRAKDANNSENAAKYYEQILAKDPNSWEANFYTIYFQSMSCRIGEIYSVEVNLINNYQSFLDLVKPLPEEERVKALEEIYLRISIIADIFFTTSKNFFKETDVSIRYEMRQETCDRLLYSFFLLYYLAAYISETFSHKYEEISAKCKEDGIKLHSEFLQIDQLMIPKESHIETIDEKAEEILKVNPNYKLPQYIINLKNELKTPVVDNNYSNSNTEGCYVATAVYGSYDCPEVWTLRRFRDFTLDETWYGRLFIKAYYATSPTFVKYFGNVKVFKLQGKKLLDKWVAKLNSKGYDNTPYKDKY